MYLHVNSYQMTDSALPKISIRKLGPPTGVNIPGDELMNKDLLKSVFSQLSQCSDREKAVVWRYIRSTLCSEDLTPEERENMREVLRGVYPIREVTNPKWPVIESQRIGSFVFLPSDDATPDKNGVYGIIRMNHQKATEEEAKANIDYINEKCDSRWRQVPLPVHKWGVCVSQADVKAWSEKHVKSGEYDGEDEEGLRRVQAIRNEVANAGQKVFQDARDKFDAEEKGRRTDINEQMDEVVDIGDDDETPEERAKRRLEKAEDPLDVKYVKSRIQRASLRHNRETLMTKVRYLDDRIDEYTKDISDMKKQDSSVHTNFDENLDRLLKEAGTTLDPELRKLL